MLLHILLQRDVLHLFDSDKVDYPTFDSLLQACFDAMDRDMEKFHSLADKQIAAGRPASVFALLEDGCIQKEQPFHHQIAQA